MNQWRCSIFTHERSPVAPTRFRTLRLEAVDTGPATTECRTSNPQPCRVGEQSLRGILSACMSDRAYNRGKSRARVPSTAAASTDMSPRSNKYAGQYSPVQRSNIGDPEIPPIAKGSTPGQVGEPPALIAYVTVSISVQRLRRLTLGSSVIGYIGCGKTTVRTTICLIFSRLQRLRL